MKTADDFSFCQDESTALSEVEGSSRTTDVDTKDYGVPSVVEHSEEKEDLGLDKLKRFFHCVLTEEGKGVGDLIHANERLTERLKHSQEEILQLRQECKRLKADNTKELKKSLATLKDGISTLEQQVQRNIQSSENDSPISWKRSQNPFACDEGDFLECQPLRFGNKYKWSIKVVSTGEDCVELGVASTIHKFDFNEGLGDQEGGWSYDSDGDARHDDVLIQRNLPEYKDGTKLTFLLDLTGNGTLSVYQDDEATNQIPLFFNMKSSMANVDSFPLGGFVPAAYCCDENGKIEFLGFEDV